MISEDCTWGRFRLLSEAAADLLAAFGGNVPDWLLPEATRLETALDLVAKDPPRFQPSAEPTPLKQAA